MVTRMLANIPEMAVSAYTTRRIQGKCCPDNGLLSPIRASINIRINIYLTMRTLLFDLQALIHQLSSFMYSFPITFVFDQSQYLRSIKMRQHILTKTIILWPRCHVKNRINLNIQSFPKQIPWTANRFA